MTATMNTKITAMTNNGATTTLCISQRDHYISTSNRLSNIRINHIRISNHKLAAASMTADAAMFACVYECGVCVSMYVCVLAINDRLSLSA